MRTLCLQFQPRRAAGLSPQVMTVLMARVAAALPHMREFSFRRGSARGPYINYFFESRTPARVWKALRGQALRHRRLGGSLRQSTIVTCQGSRGWENYLLLHHFDSAQPLDTLAGV